MTYKVIIMPPAKRSHDMYVYYTLETLKNRQAAKSILADAKATKERLSNIAAWRFDIMILNSANC